MNTKRYVDFTRKNRLSLFFRKQIKKMSCCGSNNNGNNRQAPPSEFFVSSTSSSSPAAEKTKTSVNSRGGFVAPKVSNISKTSASTGNTRISIF